MPSRDKPIRLHVEARAELQTSVTFYRERAGQHWVARFKQRVAEGFKTIAANPQRHPPVPGLPEVRKLRIEQFPFSLLYVERADYIWVVAIAHGSRKPGYWKDRIS